MTLFDLIFLGVIALSALVGFVRGGVREVVTVAAFVIAALVAVFSLRFTAGIARAAIDPDWAATGVAIVLMFIAVYIAVRVLGGGLTKSIKGSMLGKFDSIVGLAFGALRGLVALGVLHLFLHTVTSQGQMPAWISGAASYPVTAWTADHLRVLAREGSDEAGRPGPAIQDAVKAAADPGPTPAADASYEERDRQSLDDLVEERAR